MNRMPSITGVAKENLDLVDIDPNAIYSVKGLSRNIKNALAANPQLNNLILKGEISNFIRASSGHIYFSLKDENCVLACAYFRHLQEAGINDLGNGIQIVAIGSVTSFERRSQYQLNITKIIPIGDGQSTLKLTRLREKLEGEGLFKQERKKPIPILPRKIGIITSKDSAAMKDIMAVVNAICPNMDIIIAYVTLLGNNAAGSIIQALKYLTTIQDVDAIILARGGGPNEDFAVFDDEGLVRSIVLSTKPIITGIGHEKDTSLADLAADFRASTPSMAARSTCPNLLELKKSLKSLNEKLDQSYKSYHIGLEIKEKEAEIGKREIIIKQNLEGRKSDNLKHKIVILVLIALLILLSLIFLFRGVSL